MTDGAAVFGNVLLTVSELAPRSLMHHDNGTLGVSLGELRSGVQVSLHGTADELLDFAARLVAIVPREHGGSSLVDDFASAGYCHFPGCENRERVWMSDDHVALADGLCAEHSHLTCSAVRSAAI